MSAVATNDLVRYLVCDDAEQAQAARSLLGGLSSKRPGFIGRWVTVELVWVLERAYRFSRDQIHIVLDGRRRLTAMYYGFFVPDKPAPERKNRFLYLIQVSRSTDEDYVDPLEYDWTRRGLNLLEDRIRSRTRASR